jgi:hypothetical protein
MKDALKKRVNYIIEAWENLKKEGAYHVENEEGFLKDSKAILSYHKNDFKIQIISSKHPTKEEFDDPFNLLSGRLRLRRNERSIIVNVEDIKSLTQSFSDPFIATYFTRSIVVDEEALNEKLQHFALFEIDEMPSFSAFPIKAVKIDSITHYGCFSVNVQNTDYDCYCYENKDLKKTYFFIESTEEVGIDEFKEVVDTILHLIAIFNGDWYRDDLFIYSKKKDEDEWKGYKSLQFFFNKKSIITKYKICDSLRCNQYLEHIRQKEIGQKLCKRIESETFTLIANKIYKDAKIKRIIELILEGTNTKSIILRASVFSVAIETLTNIIYNKNTEILNPIKDKKLAEKINKKIYEVINEYSPFMTENAVKIYTKKIETLNKPANVDKLSNSFTILGIQLNDHDKKTIEARNTFLHGSTPFKNFEENKEKEKDFQLLTIKLRFLICMLLLKHIGYKGHLYNHYGYTKSLEAKTVIEHFVRFI